ncbi:hypothetical protein Agub_g456 [Astrephomene gubernaculifera]|uniref:Uncharacterized protein n=1 Tax=Astrephomene gubernaculifera TaxID=47775 RepID=A0AAD3DHW1_9CHLO|nr:hypothetical protein Agub_g456 [Astrephomene gubernaculifera]
MDNSGHLNLVSFAFFLCILACGGRVLSQAPAGADSQQLQPLIAEFDAVSPSQKQAWVHIWSTYARTMLCALQDARGNGQLHIYMNGDSSFRQQKNFLCNILQPGFMRGKWALDVNALHDEHESSCYNSELNIRVTFIDNSCCDTGRLAYLLHRDTDPTGKENPPAWKPRTVGQSSPAQPVVLTAATPAATSEAATVGSGLLREAAIMAGEDWVIARGQATSNAGTQALPVKSVAADVDADTETQLVLYLNCGLHLMHLGRARPFECLQQQYGYVETIQEFSRAAARLYPGSPQIFMTSNHVCESNFRGPYADALKEAAADPEGFLRQCVEIVNMTAGPLLGNIPALSYACREGLFVGHGTASLRRRMLLALREEKELRARGDHVGVVDAYALTEGQCWASQSSDGRHYPYVVPMVVMELIATMHRQLLRAH